MTIEETLAALEAVRAKATPGDWLVRPFDDGIESNPHKPGGGPSIFYDCSAEDAACAVAEHTLAPRLIAEVRLLRAAMPERYPVDDEYGAPDGTICGLCACEPCEPDCLMRPDRKLGEP